jgi:hypothetical protein
MMTAMNMASGPGCEEQSWSPEVISLYGDPETIISKLDSIDRDLTTRRVYMFTLESKENAEIAFYERSSPGKVSISRWKGKSDTTFHKAVHKAIIENKGVHCVGEQTKAIVATLPKLKKEEDIAAPVNAKAAISHQLRAHSTEYIRTTLYLMC